jgi:ABC-type branched-subunit amino acid transport system ATPase component
MSINLSGDPTSTLPRYDFSGTVVVLTGGARGIGKAIEQNLPFASPTADRFIILSHGEQVAKDDRSDLHGHEKIMALFMGPQT